MAIFVTGGTGFLGRHLIPLLCRAGHHLYVLTRTPEQHQWLRHYPNLVIIRGDIETGVDADVLAKCDFIIHAAGLFSMWSGAGDFEATNVIGTENLLRTASSVDVKRVIYVSTLAVIGNPQPDLIIDEQHPPRPADPYQASKLRAEQITKHYHEQGLLETIILRPGAFYGPLGDYAFNRLFFTDPMRGLTMQMDGGKYFIFPAYIEDVAQSILLALTQGKSGEMYNICDAPIQHKEAFRIIRSQANIWYPPLNIPGIIGLNFARLLTVISEFTNTEPFYPISMRSYVFNDWNVTNAKAQQELNFEPTPFADGVRKTLAWYKSGKPDWYDDLRC